MFPHALWMTLTPNSWQPIMTNLHLYTCIYCTYCTCDNTTPDNFNRGQILNYDNFVQTISTPLPSFPHWKIPNFHEWWYCPCMMEIWEMDKEHLDGKNKLQESFMRFKETHAWKNWVSRKKKDICLMYLLSTTASNPVCLPTIGKNPSEDRGCIPHPTFWKCSHWYLLFHKEIFASRVHYPPIFSHKPLLLFSTFLHGKLWRTQKVKVAKLPLKLCHS